MNISNIYARYKTIIGMVVTILIGSSIVVVGDWWLNWAKAKADATDNLFVSEGIVIILLVIVAAMAATAVGKSLHLPSLWNGAVCPILLSFFTLFLRNNFGVLVFSWMALDSTMVVALGRSNSHPLLVVIFTAVTCSSLATFAGSYTRQKYQIISAVVLLSFILLGLLLTVSYSQIMGEAKIRSKLMRVTVPHHMNNKYALRYIDSMLRR